MNNREIVAFYERTQRAWLAGELSFINGVDRMDRASDASCSDFVAKKVADPWHIELMNSFTPTAHEWYYDCAFTGLNEWGHANQILTNQRLFIRRSKREKHIAYWLKDISEFTYEEHILLWRKKFTLTLKMLDGTLHVHKGLGGKMPSDMLRVAISRAKSEAFKQATKDREDAASAARANEQREKDTQEKEGSREKQQRSVDSERHNQTDHFYATILGFTGHITPSELKIKYRAMIAKYHPDKVHGLGEEFHVIAERKSKEINEAYAYFRAKFDL